MVVWIDAQLAPSLADWLREAFAITARAVRDLQLRDAEDPVIFQGARDAGAVVLTKDADFVTLVGRHGPCVFRSIPIPRFGRSRSPISLEADHPFRSKPITHFARSRSPVSANGDHSVT